MEVGKELFCKGAFAGPAETRDRVDQISGPSSFSWRVSLTTTIQL